MISRKLFLLQTLSLSLKTSVTKYLYLFSYDSQQYKRSVEKKYFLCVQCFRIKLDLELTSTKIGRSINQEFSYETPLMELKKTDKTLNSVGSIIIFTLISSVDTYR